MEWTYSISREVLSSPGDTERWSAKSGGIRNKEHAPAGMYTIGTMRTGFSDTRYKENNGDPWFCPITPEKANGRIGLGIHPDGGPPGTEGCIGIAPDGDTERAKSMLKAATGEPLRVIA